MEHMKLYAFVGLIMECMEYFWKLMKENGMDDFSNYVHVGLVKIPNDEFRLNQTIVASKESRPTLDYV